MRRTVGFFLSLLFIQFLIGLYIANGLVGMTQRPSVKTGIWVFFIVEELTTFIGISLLRGKITGRYINIEMWQNIFIGLAFSLIMAKLALFIFFLLDDFIRGAAYAFAKITKPQDVAHFSSRRSFIINSGLVLVSLPFSALIYGTLKGKYDYQIKRLTLQIKDLPNKLKGLKIIQLSDIHAGNIDNIEALKGAIQLINQQQPDLILFTGDLVNRDAREIEPFIDIFKQLKATYGKFSILGNHDYVTYKEWNTKADLQANQALLYQYHKEMGFHLLRNEHSILEFGGATLAIIGVENWGKPPFPQYGDLGAALKNVPMESTKILLSHDPTHWDQQVINHDTHIHLTLSGHTHGAQFGVDSKWIKWSPVKFVYKRWSGLYEENKQLLYVNKGFGVLAFPGRVGMWPEITVLELSG